MPIPTSEYTLWTSDTFIGMGTTFEEWRKLINGLAVQNSSGILKLNGGPDVTRTSTGNPLQIGEITGLNLAFDSDEIKARLNGQHSTLFLNSDGGNVHVGFVDSESSPAGGELRLGMGSSSSTHGSYSIHAMGDRMALTWNGDINLAFGDRPSNFGGNSFNNRFGIVRDFEDSNWGPNLVIGPQTSSGGVIRELSMTIKQNGDIALGTDARLYFGRPRNNRNVTSGATAENTDEIFFRRISNGIDKSELQLVVGDSNTENTEDFFSIGRWENSNNTFVPQFKFNTSLGYLQFPDGSRQSTAGRNYEVDISDLRESISRQYGRVNLDSTLRPFEYCTVRLNNPYSTWTRTLITVTEEDEVTLRFTGGFGQYWRYTMVYPQPLSDGYSVLEPGHWISVYIPSYLSETVACIESVNHDARTITFGVPNVGANAQGYTNANVNTGTLSGTQLHNFLAIPDFKRRFVACVGYYFANDSRVDGIPAIINLSEQYRMPFSYRNGEETLYNINATCTYRSGVYTGSSTIMSLGRHHDFNGFGYENPWWVKFKGSDNNGLAYTEYVWDNKTFVLGIGGIGPYSDYISVNIRIDYNNDFILTEPEEYYSVLSCGWYFLGSYLNPRESAQPPPHDVHDDSAGINVQGRTLIPTGNYIDIGYAFYDKNLKYYKYARGNSNTFSISGSFPQAISTSRTVEFTIGNEGGGPRGWYNYQSYIVQTFNSRTNTYTTYVLYYRGPRNTDGYVLFKDGKFYLVNHQPTWIELKDGVGGVSSLNIYVYENGRLKQRL